MYVLYVLKYKGYPFSVVLCSDYRLHVLYEYMIQAIQCKILIELEKDLEIRSIIGKSSIISAVARTSQILHERRPPSIWADDWQQRHYDGKNGLQRQRGCTVITDH